MDLGGHHVIFFAGDAGSSGQASYGKAFSDTETKFSPTSTCDIFAFFLTARKAAQEHGRRSPFRSLPVFLHAAWCYEGREERLSDYRASSADRTRQSHTRQSRHACSMQISVHGALAGQSTSPAPAAAESACRRTAVNRRIDGWGTDCVPSRALTAVSSM